MTGELAGEAALCPQDAVPHSVERADQTQVFPLPLCTAAVVLSQEDPDPVLLITLVVINRLLHGWVHTLNTHTMGRVWMSSRLSHHLQCSSKVSGKEVFVGDLNDSSCSIEGDMLRSVP